MRLEIDYGWNQSNGHDAVRRKTLLNSLHQNFLHQNVVNVAKRLETNQIASYQRPNLDNKIYVSIYLCILLLSHTSISTLLQHLKNVARISFCDTFIGERLTYETIDLAKCNTTSSQSHSHSQQLEKVFAGRACIHSYTFIYIYMTVCVHACKN